jgi:dipeptidyl aminopeptidase/acylaminoacyl peptidase
MAWRLVIAALLVAGPTLGPPPLPAGRWEAHEVEGRCGGGSGAALVQVYLPRGWTPARRWPLLLALHGWNHEASRWRALGLPALADRLGLVVVAPEMGTSVYERAFRPETVQPWGPAPGACWVAEVVLPWARGALAAARGRAHAGVLGYSTGGRGALVVASRWPEFAFAGALSGTYDLAALDEATGEYRIYEAVFGPRAAFAERWQAEEIPLATKALASTRLWLAHGVADPVVPIEQQDRAAKALGRRAGLTVHRIARAGHEEAFWRAELVPLVEGLAKAVGARPGGLPPAR